MTTILIIGLITFIIILAHAADSCCENCGDDKWSDWENTIGIDCFGLNYKAKKKSCLKCGKEKLEYGFKEYSE